MASEAELCDTGAADAVPARPRVAAAKAAKVAAIIAMRFIVKILCSDQRCWHAGDPAHSESLVYQETSSTLTPKPCRRESVIRSRCRGSPIGLRHRPIYLPASPQVALEATEQHASVTMVGCPRRTLCRISPGCQTWRYARSAAP